MNGARRPRGRRIGRRLPVRFETSARRRGDGWTLDLSTLGAAFACEQPLEPNEPVRLELSLPGGEPSVLRATVRWWRLDERLAMPIHVGVQLASADMRYLRFIAQATEMLEPDEAGPLRVSPAGPGDLARPAPRTVLPRAARFPAHVPLRFGAFLQLDGQGTTLDVSAHGLSFTSDRLLAAGEPLNLALMLPDGRFGHGRGLVSWVRERSGDGVVCEAGLALLYSDPLLRAFTTQIALAR